MTPYGYPYISRYAANYDAYGTLRLTEDSGTPSTLDEPLTINEVKDYLRIDRGDNSQLELLYTFIRAAREQAEILQGRDLTTKQYDLSYDYWPAYRIELRSPVVSVDLVSYRSLDGSVTTLTENTDYIVDLVKSPAIITPPWNISWPSFTPWPSSAITIRFTSGNRNSTTFWRGRGAQIKVGMLMLISAWYENRLPFEIGRGAAVEYPFAVTYCLSSGGLQRAR